MSKQLNVGIEHGPGDYQKTENPLAGIEKPDMNKAASEWLVLIRPRLAGFEVTGDKTISFLHFGQNFRLSLRIVSTSGSVVAFRLSNISANPISLMI